MAGRKPPSMQGGWWVRAEERRTLATMEMDLDLGEGAEVVVVVDIGVAEVEVVIMVLVGNMTKASRDFRCYSDSAPLYLNL